MMTDYVARWIERADEFSSDILRGQKGFSFEDCYRTMYTLTRDSNEAIAGLVPGLWQRFRLGHSAWKSLESWLILKDIWLYPVRVASKSKSKETFSMIIATILCYTPLFNIVADRHHLPKDVRRLITNYWESA